MNDPLFFDCLTDAQLWALFMHHVLQGHRLSGEIVDRLVSVGMERGIPLMRMVGMIARGGPDTEGRSLARDEGPTQIHVSPPPPHDLNAMSLPELEAYLDEVLRVDEVNDPASTPSSSPDNSRSTAAESSSRASHPQGVPRQEA